MYQNHFWLNTITRNITSSEQTSNYLCFRIKSQLFLNSFTGISIYMNFYDDFFKDELKDKVNANFNHHLFIGIHHFLLTTTLLGMGS